MRVGMLGRKVGMTQIYETDGTAVPITVLECGPCTVLQVRTADRDGYHAVQLGFVDKKRKKATQAERGHAKKANAEPKRYVREIRQPGPTDVTEGQTLTQGQYIGTVAPDGEASNGGIAHPHLSLWSTSDGGNWDRTSEPFVGAFAMSGMEFYNSGVAFEHTGTVFYP